MKTTSPIESALKQLFTRTFPYQLPSWFSKIIAEWTWLIVPAIIIVQPWINWGYWDDVYHHTSGPNFFFWVALMVSGLAITLQLTALRGLRMRQRSGWQLLYLSAFCGPIYGVVRIFSSQGSIGPIFGMVVLSAPFFYFLFQIRPFFTSSRPGAR